MIPKALVVFAVYLLTAKVGLANHIVSSPSVTLFWIPSGFAVAALMAWGRSMIGPILLASVTVNWWVGSDFAWAGLIPAAAIGFGNLGEYVVASEGIRYFWPSSVKFVPVCAAGCVVAATVGASVVAGGAFEAWWGWWVGDALGIVLFAFPCYMLLAVTELAKPR